MAAPVLKMAIGNAASTTTSSSMTNVGTTTPLTSTTNFQAATVAGEGMVLIDEGAATEEITYSTAVSGGNLTTPLANRGLEGGSAQAHSSGVSVKGILTAGMWNDLIDALVDTLFTQSTGALKSGIQLTLPQIHDTTADHQYIFGVSELTADRTITLPLLTGNDDFVFEDHTQTLTNKRITPRVVTTTDDATAAIDCDVTDQYPLTAVANATEFTVTGTPVNGQKLIVRLKDAGVGKGLTWTGFTAIGVTLPTTTVASKTHYVGCIYNSAASTWDAVAVVAQA